MHCVAIIRFITHLANVILACLIIGAIGVSIRDTKVDGVDNCILYADVTHNSTFGNQNYCQFVLASGSISLITSLILGIITLIALCSKGDIVPTFFTVIELICSIFLFVLMLVLGSVASVGFSKTCQSFAASCLTLQEVVEATLNTSTSNLYNNLVIVQSSSWIACGVWAFFLIITIFRVRIYRRKNKNKKTKLVDEEDDSS